MKYICCCIFLCFSLFSGVCQDSLRMTVSFRGNLDEWLDLLESSFPVDFIRLEAGSGTIQVEKNYRSLPLDSLLEDLLPEWGQLAIPFGENQWITGSATALSPLQDYLNAGIRPQPVWQDESPDASQQLQEVVITDANARKSLESSLTGLHTLSPMEIKELPRLMGSVDIVKAIMTLPGVSNVGEGSTGFYVRGGNVDQNLVLLDGSLVLNMSHVLGFFSAFNPDLIGRLQLYKSQMPARYGGRLSSVLEVETKDPSFDRFRVQGGLGMVMSQLLVEVPVLKDKTALLLSGRYAYPDWFLKQTRNPDIRQSRAHFYDMHVGISQKVFGGGMVSMGLYRTHDRFQFGNAFGYSWDIANYYLKWNQPVLRDQVLQIRASASVNHNQYDEPVEFTGYVLRTGLRQQNLKALLMSSPGSDWTLQYGIELSFYQMDPQHLTGFGQQSVVIDLLVGQSNGREGALFAEANWDAGGKFAFTAGLRLSGFQQLGPGVQYIYAPGQPYLASHTIDSVGYAAGAVITSYGGLEPRLSARYLLGNRQSVKWSYSRGYQYLHLLSNSVSQTPVDVWQLSSPYIRPQQADNFSVGYYHHFRGHTYQTSLEIYYRSLENLIDYRDFPVLLLNPQIETALLRGKGRAYGAEWQLKRDRGRLTGSVSYTYSRTFIRPIEGQSVDMGRVEGYYPTFFDQPHSLKCYLSYKIGRTQQIGLNFVHNSGRPITAPVGNYVVAGNFVPHFSERNAYRIPYYQRLDISYTYHRRVLKKSGYKDSFTFSIYNVLGRRNAFSVFFKVSPEETVYQAYRLSVLGTALPSLSYHFHF